MPDKIERARNQLLVRRRIHATHIDMWPGAIETLMEMYGSNQMRFPSPPDPRTSTEPPPVVKLCGMTVREDATIEPGEFRLCAPS